MNHDETSKNMQHSLQAHRWWHTPLGFGWLYHWNRRVRKCSVCGLKQVEGLDDDGFGPWRWQTVVEKPLSERRPAQEPPPPPPAPPAPPNPYLRPTTVAEERW